MDKLWLPSCPEGVLAEIDYSQQCSLRHLIEEAFQKYTKRNTCLCISRYLTYAEVNQLSKNVDAWLQGKNLKKSACVAIMMPNVLQVSCHYISCFASRLYRSQCESFVYSP